jgi:hypothetical protein
MIFERLFLFLVLLPLVLWVMFHSHRSLGFNRFLVTASGAVVLLLAFCLPGFVLRESRAAANVLADALANLSETELDQEHDLIWNGIRADAA